MPPAGRWNECTLKQKDPESEAIFHTVLSAVIFQICSQRKHHRPKMWSHCGLRSELHQVPVKVHKPSEARELRTCSNESRIKLRRQTMSKCDPNKERSFSPKYDSDTAQMMISPIINSVFISEFIIILLYCCNFPMKAPVTGSNCGLGAQRSVCRPIRCCETFIGK